MAARGSTRTGLKASLQRRLHGLLVQAAIAAHAAEEAEAGAPVADGDAPEPDGAKRAPHGEVREGVGSRAQVFRVLFHSKGARTPKFSDGCFQSAFTLNRKRAGVFRYYRPLHATRARLRMIPAHVVRNENFWWLGLKWKRP